MFFVELAYEINVSRQSIYLWETGKSIPDVENIVRLCQILEISLSDLTKGLEKIDDISIKKKNKKIFTILLSVILIIFIVYIFISLRKFVIVSILNNKLNNYSDLDNYYCNKIYYEIDEESLKNKRYYEEKIYYKDGIYRNTYTNYEVNTEETEESIIWIDTVKKEGYIFDKSIDNLRRFDFENEKVATNDGIIAVAATNKIYRGKNELLVNFIYAFNPFFRISSSKSEVINLKISNIDFGNDKFLITGKGNKERIGYLNDITKDAILKYLKLRENITPKSKNDRDILFLSNFKKKLSSFGIEKNIDRAYEKVGLDKKVYKVHTLRHTCATILYKSGIDIRTIQELLGHVKIDTTEIYTHLHDEEVMEAMFEHPLSRFKMANAKSYCSEMAS